MPLGPTEVRDEMVSGPGYVNLAGARPLTNKPSHNLPLIRLSPYIPLSSSAWMKVETFCYFFLLSQAIGGDL